MANQLALLCALLGRTIADSLHLMHPAHCIRVC